MKLIKKSKDKNKKIIIGIIIAIAVFSIGAIGYAAVSIHKQNEELDKHLIVLTADELKTKLDNKESFILVITGSECPHCALYKPTFKKVLKDYNLTAYEIMNDKLQNDSEKAFLNSVATITGTPTTIFIRDGEEISTASRIVGNADRSKIINRLKAIGYIE